MACWKADGGLATDRRVGVRSAADHECAQRRHDRPDGTGVFGDQAGRDQALNGRMDLEWGEPHLLGESGIGHLLAVQRDELQSDS